MMYTNLEVIKNMNNNDTAIIKGKIDSNLNEAFKRILAKLNMTQQDFVERQVTEFVIKNMNIILNKDDKGSTLEK